MIEIRTVARGDAVGYGGAWRNDADHPVQVAVLAVGYADGFRRSLGNRARVLIRGGSFPVVGRVSMDLVSVLVEDRIRVPEDVGGDLDVGVEAGDTDVEAAWSLPAGDGDAKLSAVAIRALTTRLIAPILSENCDAARSIEAAARGSISYCPISSSNPFTTPTQAFRLFLISLKSPL